MMKNINKPLLQRFLHFFSNLNREDRIAIFYDADAAGTTSAAIIIKVLNQRGIKVAHATNEFHAAVYLTESHIKQLMDLGINKILFLNLAPEQTPGTLESLEKFAEILVIDHIMFDTDANSEKTVFIKPPLLFSGINKVVYCTAKLLYDLLSNVNDLSRYSWLSAIGIVGDYLSEFWADFVLECERETNLKIESDESLETYFKKVADLLSYADCVRDKAGNRALNALVESTSVLEAIEKLKEFEYVGSGIRRYVNHFESLAEGICEKNSYFLEIKSDLKISFLVSTIVSAEKHPDCFVFVYQEDPSKRFYIVEMRRFQFKRNCSDILCEAIKGLEDANAGGHASAAGARIRKGDFARFKSRLLELL